MRALTRRASIGAMVFGAAVALVAVPAAAEEPAPTQVTELTVTLDSWTVPSYENSGPAFWVEASDPEGLVSMVGRWCSEDLPDYCVSPTWTMESPGAQTWEGTRVMADVPGDAPLGFYRFRELVLTDSAGHTTTLLPGGAVLVDTAPTSQTHTFRLDGGLDVMDETVPTLHDLRWADGRDWAVVGGDNTVAMDLHVTDNWRDEVSVVVSLQDRGGTGGVGLRGTIPAVETGPQDQWVRVTGTLDDPVSEGATYYINAIDISDAAGNHSYYYPDGTGFADSRWHPQAVATQHDLDLTRFALDVRDAVPSFHTLAPIADSTLKLGWSPAKDADGSPPQHYTVHLVPLEPSGVPATQPPGTSAQWQPSNLPEREISVPSDQTELVVDGLDNGRRYEAQVVANFPDRDVADQSVGTIVWPTISYSPSVAVVEGDEGLTYAHVTARLSSPSLTDITQPVSLLNVTAYHDGDYRERYQGSLTVPAGATWATLKIPIVGDAKNEPDETFELHRHYTYAEAERGPRSTVVTILDDDPANGAPLSIGSTEVADVGAGTAPAILTVGLAHAHRKAVTVEYRTHDGSALAGTDYKARSGTLRFEPGVISRTIAIPVCGSSSTGDAAFKVRLRHGDGARISRAVGKVTIDRP